MWRSCVVSWALTVTLAVAARGQGDSARGGDSVVADSTPAVPTFPLLPVAPPPPPPPPPPPTPEQERYLKGLQRVGRGIAQLKTAVDQAARGQASRDTLSQRRTAHRLGGYCGSARVFMTGGRAQMQHTAYADSTGLKARQLTQTVDALIKYAPTCETEAAGAVARVSGELVKRLEAYDAALADFRAAVGLPTGRDSGAVVKP
jgi:hypothetical protein